MIALALGVFGNVSILLPIVLITNLLLPLFPPWVNWIGYTWILGLDEYETTDWGLIVDLVAFYL